MRTMRVSQLDAAELDEALVSMLASKLTDSLDVFGVRLSPPKHVNVPFATYDTTVSYRL